MVWREILSRLWDQKDPALRAELEAYMTQGFDRPLVVLDEASTKARAMVCQTIAEMCFLSEATELKKLKLRAQSQAEG